MVSKNWKSVADGKSPIGEKVLGTFRDRDFTGEPDTLVDEMDAFCIEHGIKRSEYLSLMDDVYDSWEELREADDAERSRELWREIRNWPGLRSRLGEDEDPEGTNGPS